jgi:site-specific DNA-methyltransferase (adenine-specific)
MTLHYEDGGLRLFHGSNRDILPTFASESFDSIVTDPPYELGFMGKGWDSSGIAYDVEVWRECFRVLKPGGYLLSFGGTRTWHRIATAIEDAGFEIRDSIAWMYGSGFPKSMDVSKAIDKAAGAEREVIGYDASKARPNKENFAKRTDRQPSSGAAEGWKDNGATITGPATDEARVWEGWGTALKPAFEPIIVARKPLVGTVAANVIAHGTGAINIDACRVEFASEADRRESTEKNQHARFGTNPGQNKVYGDYSQTEMKDYDGSKGRFPSNVLLDPTQAAALNDAGRFFPTFRYEAKAPGSERPTVDGVAHATVKPLDLMRWLVRLVTCPGGRVLDLYAGSGTTGEAALLEGMEVDLIELEAEHLPLILQRVRKPLQPSMFGDWGEAL